MSTPLSTLISSDQQNIPPGAVHVWFISLEADSELVQSASEVLCVEEKERAQRFWLERDKRRFTIAHAAMRGILAQYIKVEPQRIAPCRGKMGKPELAPALNRADLKFNLSHSSEVALLAVTRDRRLGIDVEAVRRHIAVEELAAHFFSAEEMRTLLELPEEQRTEAFFCCWTRKEAYIKALGAGLSIPLDSFTVSFQPNTAPALLRVNDNANEARRWSVYDLDVGPGYKAALVVEGKACELFRWEWEIGSK